MGATSATPIVLGFVLGIIPFALWTWWMVRQERNARVAGSVGLTRSGEALVRTAPADDVTVKAALPEGAGRGRTTALAARADRSLSSEFPR